MIVRRFKCLDLKDLKVQIVVYLPCSVFQELHWELYCMRREKRLYGFCYIRIMKTEACHCERGTEVVITRRFNVPLFFL